MQTTNGTTSNGAQARSGLTGQPTAYVHGANTATPSVNNNQPATMRVAHHNAYAPQGPQAQRSFPVQYTMPNTNGITYEMTVRGNSGAPMRVTQGHHAQVAQQDPQAYQWLPNHQAANNNPITGFGPYQLVWSVEPQSCRPQHPQLCQSPQQHQSPQYYQTQPYLGPQDQNVQQYHAQQYQPQQYQNPATNPTVYASTSDDNVSLVDSARLSTSQAPHQANHPATSFHHPNGPGVEHHTGSDSPSITANTQSVDAADVGVAEAVLVSANTEGPEGFQDHVKALVEEKGNAFRGHIRTAEDYQRYKLAVWKAKRSGGSYRNKAQDYPTDEAGQMRARKQIFDAFVNLGGEQDSISETADFNNCLAVRTVRGLSPLEVELVVHQFMVSSPLIILVKKSNSNLFVNTGGHAESPVGRTRDCAGL